MALKNIVQRGLFEPPGKQRKEKRPVRGAVVTNVSKTEAPAHRFRLQVDRQTKSEFDSVEAAEVAGHLIKKAHPVVQVSIFDALENKRKVLS